MLFDFGSYVIATKSSYYIYRYFKKYDIGLDENFLLDVNNNITKHNTIFLIKNL